ncbi:DUF488 domain-containing protein [Reyranella sp. MMS21-HV4-11]|uniref:DUF488 domain-containing protein n=1 Tax=Reyranella humidisoli TaxID=2849149 RepID=A0ABS6IHT4_9HYPH|nr:DUF488 domain-containing protein [Reyranella sp. MMS21-HV4-11]MBU8874015.1 DUF488 domain-containing protein [Reyranella sp. MMS21-HV4-11]
MKSVKTIGHSNHPIERFVALLKAGGVDRLVDVRSTPWSRRHPQFGREKLAKSLAEAGIAYVHEGAALGGKPAAGGSYDQLAARPDFKAGLDRVIEGADGKTLCLMCAEKEPLDCHRTVLLSRRLAERGVTIEHLLADGGTQPHHAVEEVLLGKEAAPDLFEDRAARLARAWRRLETKWGRAGTGEGE